MRCGWCQRTAEVLTYVWIEHPEPALDGTSHAQVWMCQRCLFRHVMKVTRSRPSLHRYRDRRLGRRQAKSLSEWAQLPSVLGWQLIATARALN